MKERNKQIQRRDSGFTLIEILLVVVIIGILAAVAVPRLGGRVAQSQIAAAKASIGAIGTAIDLYETDNGKLPASLQNLMTKGSEANWNGPYLRKAESLKDPWGKEFKYTKQNNGVYEITSGGPDENFGGSDDIK
ncbi:MAG: type II secretion system major pseudopilin GspG [Holophagae bacterium]|nr:type II secretion system major pseudopilin GspG [Holophagae bacterium]